MPCPTTVAFVVWIEKREGKKVWLKGEVRSIHTVKTSTKADDDDESVGQKWIGANSVKYAEASALFIKLSSHPQGKK